MLRKIPELIKIDYDHMITKESDEEFMYHLQEALLLTLKEQGRLNTMQYRYAADKLKTQKMKIAASVNKLD